MQKPNETDNSPNKSEKKSGKRAYHWLLWWRIDPDELEKQVVEYHSLKFYQSARGISFLLLLFSCLITAGFIIAGLVGSEALFDSILFIFFGVFIYRGHRWALIGGMLLWTLEKLSMLVVSPLKSGHIPPSNLIVQVIWWTIYMHAFYLSLKVENERKRRQTPI